MEFSQFHPSKFTIGGVMYRCAEEYMMYYKASTFKDYITAPQKYGGEIPQRNEMIGQKGKEF